MSIDFTEGEVVPGTHYRVVYRIGQGGMGSVYEVEHIELGKRFVLKALLPQFLKRKDLVQRLRNEWRSLGKLEHPNIVSVSDAGVAKNGVPFYVMERLQGETLAAALKKSGSLPLIESLRIACEILEGLSAAHEIGVVHRDVKPPNIFLTQGGVAKVLDFGIAKLTDEASLELTGKGIAIGTPRYMSPEQAAGEAVDGRADLYAVGLLLFEMIAGVGPFDSGDPNEVFLAHLTRQPPRLATLAPRVPAEVDGLAAALLAKHPHERPATAGAAARILRGILRSMPQPRPDTVNSPFAGALTPILVPALHAAERGSKPPEGPLGNRVVRGVVQPSFPPTGTHAAPNLGTTLRNPEQDAAGNSPARGWVPAQLGGYPPDLATVSLTGVPPVRPSNQRLPGASGRGSGPPPRPSGPPFSLSQAATFNDAPPTRTAIPSPSTPPPVSNNSVASARGRRSSAPPPPTSRAKAIALASVSAGFASVLVAAVWLLQSHAERPSAAASAVADDGNAALAPAKPGAGVPGNVAAAALAAAPVVPAGQAPAAAIAPAAAVPASPPAAQKTEDPVLERSTRKRTTEATRGGSRSETSRAELSRRLVARSGGADQDVQTSSVTSPGTQPRGANLSGSLPGPAPALGSAAITRGATAGGRRLPEPGFPIEGN